MVGIIIPNWNGKNFLEICLDSLEKQIFKDFEVFLVDNGSTDGSQEYVKKFFPKVKIIQLDKNYGLGTAINVGIKEALKNEKIKYLALLNNDIKADPKWLEELVRAADLPVKNNVGIFASKILFMDSPEIIFSTGQILKWGFIQERGFGKKDKNQFDNKINVVGASCAACLYKREIIEEIGLYRDELFFHGVDPEFSWRAKKHGWKAKFVPNSIVYHKGNLYLARKKCSNNEKNSIISDLKNLIFIVKIHGTIKNKTLLSLILFQGITVHWIKIHSVKPDWKIKLNYKSIINLWNKNENWII